jgi:hypothetical protein
METLQAVGTLFFLYFFPPILHVLISAIVLSHVKNQIRHAEIHWMCVQTSFL